MSRHKPPIVAVVGPLAPPTNGVSMMTEIVLNSRLRRSFRVVHVDTSDHRGISAVARLDGPNVVLACRHAVAFLAMLFRKPDLVYLPLARNRLGFLRDAIFLILGRASAACCVVHFHGRGFSEFYEHESRWVRALIRLALPSTTWVVVLGEGQRAEFRGLVDNARIQVLPNGIPDHASSSIEAESREPVVLHLSNLWREKGVFDVLEVASRTRADVPGARFVFAGPWYEESERLEAERFVADRGLGDRVQFVGPVHGTAKAELLREAAVLMFPSRYAFECHPLVVLEALCSGTPVIATRIGCVGETIEDGREGFLVEEGDVNALCTHLVELLCDEPRRRRMGTAGRKRYEEMFTADRFALGLEAIWHTALAAKDSTLESAVTGGGGEKT